MSESTSDLVSRIQDVINQGSNYHMAKLTQAQQDELFTTSVAAEYALRLQLARKPIAKWAEGETAETYNRKRMTAIKAEFDAHAALEAKKADQFTRG